MRAEGIMAVKAGEVCAAGCQPENGWTGEFDVRMTCETIPTGRCECVARASAA